MNLRALPLTVALAIGSSGCWFGKKAAVAPPPPAPQPVAVNPTPAAPPAPDVAKTETPQPTPQPKPAPPPRPAPQASAPQVTVTPPAEPAPAVRLGEILTDDRRRQYEADFNRNVSDAQAALKQASTRTLTATQKQSVGRIRTFLQQADQAKSNDLVTAVQLARRADLLAQDLRKSLK